MNESEFVFLQTRACGWCGVLAAIGGLHLIGEAGALNISALSTVYLFVTGAASFLIGAGLALSNLAIKAKM